MNILILPSWFRIKRIKTLGSFFLEQAVAMQKNGHDVTMISTQDVKTGEYIKNVFRNNHYTEDGVEIYDFYVPNIIRITPDIRLKFYISKVEKIFKRLLKNQKFDVIHAHSYFPSGVAAVYLSKKYNIPCTLTEHYSSLVNTKRPSDEIKHFTKTVENMSGFACVSESFGEKIAEKFDLKQLPEVMPNVLNPLFKYAEPIKKDKFTFVSVARFVPLKRTEMVIKAMSKLINEGYNVCLKVAGDGPSRENVENAVKEFGVEEHVELLGNLPREKVYKLYQEGDAFVMVSTIETFGVVYMEALATGRPVIASRNGGANYLVNNDNGYLIDVDDEDGLEDVMKKMVDGYSKFDLKKISDDTIAKYSERSVALKYEKFYSDAIKRFNAVR